MSIRPDRNGGTAQTLSAAESFWHTHVASQNARAVDMMAAGMIARITSPRSMSPRRVAVPQMDRYTMAAAVSAYYEHPSRTSPRHGSPRSARGKLPPLSPRDAPASPRNMQETLPKSLSARPGLASATQAKLDPKLFGSVSDAVNSRFKDMHRAFKYMDMDSSGTLNKQELQRAIALWNLPFSNEQLDSVSKHNGIAPIPWRYAFSNHPCCA